MSTPKLQHYVPQMILRRFTDENGSLYCCRGADAGKPIWKRKPENVFAENHLYTLYNDDGKPDVSIEKDFSILEGEVSGIIDRLLEAALKGRTPCMDADEKDCWLRYLCRQRRRTPDGARAIVEKHMDQQIDEFPAFYEAYVGRPCTLDELAQINDPADHERYRKNAFSRFSSFEPRADVMEMLRNTSIVTAVIQTPKKNFVCGSRPIDGFGDWFTMDSKVAVKLICPNGIDNLVVLDNTSTSVIRQINEDIVERSTFFAGPSQELIESLACPR